MELIYRKRKWLVIDFDASHFPKFEEFEVKHDYLMSEKRGLQVGHHRDYHFILER